MLCHDELNRSTPFADASNDKKMALNIDTAKITTVSFKGDFTDLHLSIATTTSLELEHLELSDVVGLSQLTNLAVLSLHRNLLKEIPAGIEHLPLQRLHLSSNRLTSDTWRDELAQLAGSLRSLYLHQNQLRYVPPLNGFSLLTRISLTGNRLADWTTVLPPAHQSVAMSQEQLIALVDFCGDPAAAWRWARRRIFVVCVAWHELELPDLQQLMILDALDERIANAKLFAKWQVVQTVKQRRT